MVTVDNDQATSTSQHAANATWRDHKRYLWLLAIVMPGLTFAAVGFHAASGSSFWLWLGPVVILGVVPLLDLVTGLDGSNPPDEVIDALSEDRYYRWLTFAFLPLQYAGFILAFWVIARGDLSTIDKVGLAITVGFIGGLAINTAHELGHKRDRSEKWLAKIALAQSGYGHFTTEHNRGHHVRVATPEDPASSRLGESFYAFWPRTVFGSLRSSWRLESSRFSRRGQRVIRPSNDILNAWSMTAVLWVSLVVWLGIGIVPYLVLQAFVAITLLEAVNYLEHYGLLRQRVVSAGRDRYERVEPRHSWNSNNVATNVMLFHLQRHSDHHANPTRRYQALRDFSEAPALPTGYAGMIIIALVPPLWRRVMDPRVEAHYDGDLTLANLTPRRRATLNASSDAAESAMAAVIADDPPAPQLTAVTGREAPRRFGCPTCGYVYDEALGDPREGFPPGTSWALVPDAWCCPDCGVREKIDFAAIVRV